VLMPLAKGPTKSTPLFVSPQEQRERAKKLKSPHTANSVSSVAPGRGDAIGIRAVTSRVKKVSVQEELLRAASAATTGEAVESGGESGRDRGSPSHVKTEVTQERGDVGAQVTSGSRGRGEAVLAADCIHIESVISFNASRSSTALSADTGVKFSDIDI